MAVLSSKKKSKHLAGDVSPEIINGAMIGKMGRADAKRDVHKGTEKDQFLPALMKEIKKVDKLHSSENEVKITNLDVLRGVEKVRSFAGRSTLGLKVNSKSRCNGLTSDKIVEKWQMKGDGDNFNSTEKESLGSEKRASILSLLKTFRNGFSVNTDEPSGSPSKSDVSHVWESIDVSPLECKSIQNDSQGGDGKGGNVVLVEDSVHKTSNEKIPSNSVADPSMEGEQQELVLPPQGQEVLQNTFETLDILKESFPLDEETKLNDDTPSIGNYNQQILTDPYEFVYGETIQTPSDLPVRFNSSTLKSFHNLFDLLSVKPLREDTPLSEAGEYILKHTKRKLKQLEETAESCNKTNTRITTALENEKRSNRRLLEENKRLKEELSKMKIVSPVKEGSNLQARVSNEVTVNQPRPLTDRTNTNAHVTASDSNNNSNDKNNNHHYHNQQKQQKTKDKIGVPNNAGTLPDQGEQIETFFKEQTLNFLFNLGSDFKGILREDVLAFYNERLKTLSYAMSLINMSPSPTRYQVVGLKLQIVQFYSDVLRKYIIYGVLAEWNMKTRASGFLTEQLANMRREKRSQLRERLAMLDLNSMGM